jgi:hypothetical protein
MIFAQIETAAELAKQAGAESGWIAMALVIFVTSALGLFAYMVRGDRMELREINKFVRTEMPDVIDGNTIVVSRFIETLKHRPCLSDSDFSKIQGGNGTRIEDGELAELDGAAKKAVARVQRRAARREKADESSNG